MTLAAENTADQQRELRVGVAPGPAEGTWTVTFEAPAVAGLLALFAGTLTAERLDIISALVNVRANGTVSDSFDVIPLAHETFGPDDAARIEARAAAALADGSSLETELHELRSRHPGPAIVEPPHVELSTDSELSLGIKVVCADRPGLLYDIASTLTSHRLRTRSIAVLTFRQRAHDTFRVVDGTGKPPKDPHLLEELKESLLRVCG